MAWQIIELDDGTQWATDGTEGFPVAQGPALRDTLSHTVDHLRKMLEKVAGSSGVMLRVDQDAARNQARRAEELLKEIDSV